MKNPQGRIKKLKNEIEKGEFKGLIIDRSQYQQDIDTQIDQLDGELQKAGGSAEIPELESAGGQYFVGFGYVSPGRENLDRLHSEKLESDEQEKRNYPKGKTEKDQNP